MRKKGAAAEGNVWQTVPGQEDKILLTVAKSGGELCIRLHSVQGKTGIMEFPGFMQEIHSADAAFGKTHWLFYLSRNALHLSTKLKKRSKNNGKESDLPRRSNGTYHPA